MGDENTMTEIKRFNGKEYRGPYREFPNRREAERAAKDMRASNMLVRIEKKMYATTGNPMRKTLVVYVLWLRSKERDRK